MKLTAGIEKKMSIITRHLLPAIRASVRHAHWPTKLGVQANAFRAYAVHPSNIRAFSISTKAMFANARNNEYQDIIEGDGQLMDRLVGMLENRRTFDAQKLFELRSAELSFEECQELIFRTFDTMKDDRVRDKKAPERITRNKTGGSRTIWLIFRDMTDRFPDAEISSRLFLILLKSIGNINMGENIFKVTDMMKRQGATVDAHKFVMAVDEFAASGSAVVGLKWLKSLDPASTPGFADAYIRFCDRHLQTSVRRVGDNVQKLKEQVDLIDMKFLEEVLANAPEPADEYNAVRRNQSLMMIYGMHGDMDKAMSKFEEHVRLRNSAPSIEAYQSLIRVAHYNEKHEIVAKIYDEILNGNAAEFRYLRDSFFCLIDSLDKLNNLEGVKKVAEEALHISFRTNAGRAELINRYFPSVLDILSKHPEMEELAGEYHNRISENKNVSSTVNGQAVLNSLLDSLRANDVNDVLEKFDHARVACQRPLSVPVYAVADFMRKQKSLDGFQKLNKILTSNKQKLPYPVAVIYVETLAELEEHEKAHKFFKNMVEVEKYTFKNFDDMVKVFYKSPVAGHLDYALKCAESCDAIRNVRFRQIDEAVHTSHYNLALRQYVNDRNSKAVVELFKRMISKNNKIACPPDQSTFNSVLWSYVRDFNMEGFEQLYTALRANVKDMPSRESRQEKWAISCDFYESLPSDVDPMLVAPPYVAPNRVTENMRISAYVNVNRIDEARAAVKDSFLGYPKNFLANPSQMTYQIVAMCQMRMLDSQFWSSRVLQVKIAQEMQKVFGSAEFTEENWKDAETSMKNITQSALEGYNPADFKTQSAPASASE